MNWIKEEKLYPLIALFLILIMAVRMPLDTDMWWHLRAGEQTMINKGVYAVDTFSFTRNGSDWINHSWLSQVLKTGQRIRCSRSVKLSLSGRGRHVDQIDVE